MAVVLPSGTTASQRLLLPSSTTASQRWKIARQIIVVTRFKKKFSTKTVSCSILTTIQQAQESNAREGLTVTTNQHAGAPFSPGEALTEGKPHQKRSKRTPNNNAQKPSPKVHHALPGNWQQQVLQLTFFYEILLIADLLDHPAAVPFNFTVTFIALAPDSDGVKSITDRLMRSSNISKILFLLICFGSFGIKGAYAQDDNEDRVLKNEDELAFVWKLLVGLLTITVCGWIIHRVQAVPPSAAPALALPAIAGPGLVPPAIGAPVLPPPAIGAPALPPPAIVAPALPPPAIVAPALPPPAIVAPALPPPAIVAPNLGLVIMPNLEHGAPRISDRRFHCQDKFPGMEEFLWDL